MMQAKRKTGSSMPRTMLCAALALNAVLGAAAATLEEGFRNPPGDARPQTFYHLMNGNVTKEGLTRDFEEIAKAGLGGVLIVDVACFVPPGPLKFNTPEWYDLLRHAQREAKRLGLEITLSNCSGWSNSGGPWIAPEVEFEAAGAPRLQVEP